MKNSLTKKLSISIITGWLALIGGAAAQGAEPMRLTLDPDKPLVIGVGTRMATTLQFPSKNARVLKRSLPKLYEGVQHRKVALRHDDGNVSTLILEIYRFPKEDTLTFIAEIENRLDYAIAYDPGSMQLRVGKRVYPLNVVDASGFVPANSKARAHILLKGDTEGARAHLSIKNDFRLVMAEYSRFEQPPDLLTDYLEPLDEGLDPVVRPTPDGSPPSAGLLPPLNTVNTSNTIERSTGK